MACGGRMNIVQQFLREMEPLSAWRKRRRIRTKEYSHKLLKEKRIPGAVRLPNEWWLPKKSRVLPSKNKAGRPRKKAGMM